MADALSTQLAQQLVQWNQPNGPQLAADGIARIADETGDARAESLAAWAFGSTGNWARAAEYARTAAQKGVVGSASWVANNIQGQGDFALRRAAIELHAAAAEAGAAVDFSGMAQMFVQQGDVDGAAEAISKLAITRPEGARAHWDTLLSNVEPEVQSISDSAVKASAERDRVLVEMNRDRDAVASERESVERLVAEVGGLANKAGGLALANDYGRRANKIERQANWSTIVAIALAVAIALVALALAIDAGRDNDPLDAVLKKAPITIPFLLLNIYIARLASTFREEAIKLRGIELQIRTANPFLGALDPERRQAVLAMLALRFFPGQEVAGSGKTPSEPTDPGQAFAALLSQHPGLGGTAGTSHNDGSGT